MPREITDHIAFLREARTALLELEEWKAAREGWEAEEKRSEKTLSEERRIVTDNVHSTIKKRREEIAETYTNEIRNEMEKIKKEKSKRAKAKEQGIRARMTEETAHLVAENAGLKTQSRELFRKNGVPSFCNTLFYYALYFPRGMKEILILSAMVLLWVLVLPSVIFLVIPNAPSWLFVVLVVVFVVLWLAFYIGFGNKTKIPYFSTLKEGRRIRSQIYSNQRRIKRIKKSIRKDHNEDVYNLAQYDRTIVELEEEIRSLKQKQEEALKVFDEQTDPLIRKEIEENSAGRLSNLEQNLEEVRKKRADAEAQVKARTISCAEEYEAYIGKEFMTKERLDSLISIFQTQSPANLTEAEDIYRTGGQKKAL